MTMDCNTIRHQTYRKDQAMSPTDSGCSCPDPLRAVNPSCALHGHSPEPLLADSANYSLGYRSAVATLDSRAEKAEAERDRLTVDLSLLSKSCGHWKRSAEKAEAKTADVLADLKALADKLGEPDSWNSLSEDSFPHVINRINALIAKYETA